MRITDEYYAEPLQGNRAQMWYSLIVDGETVINHKDGSPAPLETVRRYERSHTTEVNK